MDRLRLMNLRQEEVMFNIFVQFDLEITDCLVTRIFVLINKYYSSFLVLEADWNKINSEIPWEEFVLNDYILTSPHDFIIELKIPSFVQYADAGEVFVEYFDSMTIYYGLEESTNRNSIGVDFYGNVYTNTRYDWDSVNKVNIPINQEASAEKNREIMASFVQALEKLLSGEITEFLSPHYLEEDHIYKYGIKHYAKLKDMIRS